MTRSRDDVIVVPPYLLLNLKLAIRTGFQRVRLRKNFQPSFFSLFAILAPYSFPHFAYSIHFILAFLGWFFKYSQKNYS